MKILRSMVPVLSAVVILFTCLVSPVFADSSMPVINYNDYVTNSTVNHSAETVSVTFPYQMNYWEWYNPAFASSDQKHGNRFIQIKPNDILPDDDGSYYVTFGIRPHGSNLIDLSNIPNDTFFDLSYEFNFYEAFFDSFSIDAYVTAYFYDDNKEYIYDDTVTFIESEDFKNTISANFSLRSLGLTDACSYLLLEVHIDLTSTMKPGNTSNLTLRLYDLKMSFTLAGLSTLVDQNNKLIEQNEEIKTALDNIKNGSSSEHAAADKFGSDVDQVTGELGSMGDKLNEVPKESIDVSQLVPTQILTGTHFLAYVDAFNNFWDCPEIIVILVTLGGLLLASYLLFGEKG